jgi:hypothetical protein
MLVVVFVAFAFSSQTRATDAEDIYNNVLILHGLELGTGGRSVALGGAYRGLSDDLSGLYWNPAGLASVRRIEFGLGLSQGLINDQTKIGQNPTLDNPLSRTRLNELGIVFPIPTYTGSLVFAFGYHQVHSFDSYGIFRSVDQQNDFQADEMESGRLGMWSLGGALDVSQAVSFGLALRLWTGFIDYSYDDQNVSVADPLTYDEFSDNINTDLRGVNLLAGVTLKPLPWLRIGGILETPVRFRMEESGSSHSVTSQAGQITESNDSWGYTYHVSRPWQLGTGVAVLIQRFGISADARMTDWSQTSFTDDTPVTYLTREEANNMIARKLRTAIDWHLGLEYWLPFANARIQLGYAYIPTPFTTTEVLSAKNVYSGGFSVLVDPSFQVQGSAAFANWQRTLGGWDEDLRLSQFMLTFSYRI